jgi:hypothetical protein
VSRESQTTPGIEIQPLVMTSGEEVQNQVFLDNVRVPKSNVLGQTDNGWTVAKYLLVHERGGAASPWPQVMVMVQLWPTRPRVSLGRMARRLADLTSVWAATTAATGADQLRRTQTGPGSRCVPGPVCLFSVVQLYPVSSCGRGPLRRI